MTHPDASAQKVGFIGIGRMGRGMAANLLCSGVDLTVMDADGARAEDFVREFGGQCAAQAAELAGCKVVIAMLPDGRAVHGVAMALAGHLQPGAIVVDMGSSEPHGTRELGRQLARHGVALIDAAAVGNAHDAAAGTLRIVHGCDDAIALEQVLPLLRAMGSQLFAVGGAGCGHAAKALDDHVAARTLAASCEALLVGERIGIELTALTQVIEGSIGRKLYPDALLTARAAGHDFVTGLALGLFAREAGDVRDLLDAGPGIGRDNALATPAALLDLTARSPPRDTRQTAAD
ncbi:MAG: NAD(P)-dependent oxidoreductase [Variovorax sp.]|nr:NAD(P)-dependent oxidoreductase [Variovorax sp.]